MTIEVVDLWKHGKELFEGDEDSYPGVDFVNVTPQEMYRCIRFFLEQSREGTFNLRLAEDPQIMVVATAPYVAAGAFTDGQIIGALGVDFAGLPTLVIYVQAPDMFTVSYARGEWNALRVILFFDLLHRLYELAPTADILPDDMNYSYQERLVFMQLWQAYADA
jgi:hypothetical protein